MRHDRDAGGPAGVLAAKAALRQEVRSAMREARVARILAPQLYPAGTIPLTGHDVPVDFIITPGRVIDCRAGHAPRTAAGICWEDLTEEKIAATPLLTALRSGS